jgi:5-methylcytosine-specific restriction endonuclease McrA
VVLRTKGGPSTWENMVCACADCNNKKGERRPEQMGMRLRRTPKRPNNVSFLRNLIGSDQQRWKPYLFVD